MKANKPEVQAELSDIELDYLTIIKAQDAEHRKQIARLQAECEKLAGAHKKAEQERDFLVAEYERAVGCGSQGFAHAVGHLFNAITNAKADINTEHFLALCNERDALKAENEKLRKDMEWYQIRLEVIRNLCPGAPSNTELDIAINAAMQIDRL